MWLAPNLITLTGMMALVTSYYLNAIYMPTLTGASLPLVFPPRSWWFVNRHEDIEVVAAVLLKDDAQAPDAVQ